MDKVGHQIEKYQLIALLGRGSFAEVYLGQHIQIHNLYAAIKILNTRLSESYQEGFQREAEIITRLRHPNIIRILDYGIDTSDNSPYLAMDYAPQGTLRKRHPRGTTVPMETLLTYVKQIAAALQYAHDRNLIHRDLKPENLLVGENNEIVVSDFGIATIVHATSTLGTSVYSGTVTYSAPEQILGKPRVQSDEYALGVMLYEWLTGDIPFQGSFPELCTQHLYATPQPLYEKVPGIPGEVEEVVMTALAKDPHQRFARIEAFARAFEQTYAMSSYPTLPSEKPAPSQPTPLERGPIQKPEQVPPQGEIVSIPPQQSAVETPLSIHEETSEKYQEPVSGQSTSNEVKPEQVAIQKEMVSESQPSIVETVPPLHGIPSGERVEPVPSQSTEKQSQPSMVSSQAPSPVPIAPTQPAQPKTPFPATSLSGLATPVVSPARQQPKNVPLWVAVGVAAAIVILLVVTPLIGQHNRPISNAEATATALATLSVDNPNPYGGSGTLALYDPLSQPDRWYNSSDNSWGGACQFTNGTYHISQSKPHRYNICSVPALNFSNFVFEVQMNIIKGDCGGIDFRNDGSNGKAYNFDVCQDGHYNLNRFTDHTASMSRTSNSSLAISTGWNQSNTIAVAANGSTVDLYVNKQKIASVTDSTYSHGTIGLFALDGSNPTEVIYSYARLWTLSQMQVATAQAAQTATAIKASNDYVQITSGTPVLTDPLIGQDANNWDVNSAKDRGCIFEGGAYHIISWQVGSYIPCVAKATNFSNFAFQTEMTIIKGTTGGLLIRVGGGSYGYRFGFGQDMNVIYNSKVLTTSTAITAKLNQTYLMTVIARGSNMSLYVDKQWIATVEDSSASSGAIGLLAYQGEVVFRNVKVWILS